VGSRVTDWALYGHLWGTDELRTVFDERPRIQAWLDILAELARAQADLGIVPSGAAEAIAEGVSVDRLDLDFVAEETRRTGHSTLGLIHGVQRVLPPEAAEWVYFGATVQDLTDTWTALAMKKVGAVAWRDLRAIERCCLDLAVRHRDSVMAGRTHGQPGAPITFGLKAAGWADEVRRHLDRLRDGAPRWLVGQLGGAVGTLAFFGDRGLELREAFSRRVGLADPGISWLTSRDRLSEFVGLLAMIASTLARIGTEVYELQRPEIGELREPTSPGAVGSITMPHKRNPEASEHLVTLSRLVRRWASPNVAVVAADAARPPFRGGFESVLLDAPCSGLGTLGRNPDVKWRVTSADISRADVARQARRQRDLLDSVSGLVKPGGLLVYSVCSTEREEGEDVVEPFLAANPSFKTFPLPVWTSPFSQGPFLRTLPERDRGDGFFVAVLRRL